MKARELREYLQTLDGGWVNWERTVDTFKAGDPESEIEGIAVGWMSYTWALKKGLELGCNLFVTHEPTFYDHLDLEQEVFRFPCAQEKRRLLEESGMVVLRCHDLWDQFPGIGIPDSWAEQLGFAGPVGGEGYYRVFDVTGRTAREVAAQVAERTAELGQDGVQLIGPGEKPVSRVAIGTGAITPFRHFIEAYEADLAICTDDGFTYWRDGGLAIDMGMPVIIVNHAVAEIRGMELLAGHLREEFPEFPVHYIEQRCMFATVRG